MSLVWANVNCQSSPQSPVKQEGEIGVGKVHTVTSDQIGSEADLRTFVDANVGVVLQERFQFTHHIIVEQSALQIGFRIIA